MRDLNILMNNISEAPIREELLSAMVTQYSQFKSRYLDTKGKNKLSDKERISYLISST